jgi:hypothetical protein
MLGMRPEQEGGWTKQLKRLGITLIDDIDGVDKVLSYRLSGNELMPGGLSHEEVLKLIKLFTDAGENYFNTDGIMRPMMQGMPKKYNNMLEPWEFQKSSDPENIIRSIDKYGVDIACLLPESMMDTTGYSSRWYTNGDTWKAVQSHPDRFIMEPNLSPIKHRGVENAIHHH